MDTFLLSLSVSAVIVALITMGAAVMRLAIFKTQRIISQLRRSGAGADRSGQAPRSWQYLSDSTCQLSDTWVQVKIADNGQGISKAHLDRIFDPFFTTKPVGKGTGLGLSTSHQIIVEQHGGRLLCDSEPGSGTEFTVELPVGSPTAFPRTLAKPDCIPDEPARPCRQ